MEFLSGLTVSAVAMALLWFLASVVLLGASIVAVVLLLRLVVRRQSWRALWSGTPPVKELSGKVKVLGSELELVAKLREQDDKQIHTLYERLTELEENHNRVAGVLGHLLEDLSEEPTGGGGG